MSQDDVLLGYRLQLFDLAARSSVSEACRTFGVHRSTFYRWKRRIERHGLEILRPRERRRPRLPNQLSPLVEERILAFALGHPGLGPKRIAAQLRRPRWGGLVVSHNGVWGLPAPPRAQHPGQAALARRRLRRSLRAPTPARARPPRRGNPPRGARRLRLLLGRTTLRHQRRGLAANRDRRRLLLRLGRTRHLHQGQPHGRADLQARAEGRGRPLGRGLAARTGALR